MSHSSLAGCLLHRFIFSCYLLLDIIVRRVYSGRVRVTAATVEAFRRKKFAFATEVTTLKLFLEGLKCRSHRSDFVTCRCVFSKQCRHQGKAFSRVPFSGF
jgi:hypothetical protein